MSKSPHPVPGSAAERVEQALQFLEGRWKLVILFRLFGGKVLRFSELERSIPAISQKMLIQQLRQMEQDGIVRRIVHHQVPPKVEYASPTGGRPCARRSMRSSAGPRRDPGYSPWPRPMRSSPSASPAARGAGRR